MICSQEQYDTLAFTICSMNAYHKRSTEEQKKQKLLARRKRLRDMLERENKEFEVLFYALCSGYVFKCA